MFHNKHIVIYSHGFGVQKDDRGLLSDIAAHLPEVESILFDYYEVNEAAKTLMTCAFSDAAAKLNEKIAQAKQANPGAIIDIIAHSQGTVVAALAKPAGIRQTLFLCAPFNMGIERTLARYSGQPGTVIDMEGITIFPPVDGLARLVPAKYWQERKVLDVMAAYNDLAERTELTAIIADQDELIAKEDLTTLSPKIKLINLDGDHGFYGSARQPMIEVVRKLILNI